MSSYNILDLKIFSDIQERVNALTEQDLESLRPGQPIPEGAEVIDKLSPTLRALLVIRDQLCFASNISLSELARNAMDMTREENEWAGRRQAELEDEARYFSSIFLSAVRHEFPQIGDLSFDYGPEFQVYVLADSKR